VALCAAVVCGITSNTGSSFKHVMAGCGFCDFERLVEIDEREEDSYLPDRDYKKRYKRSTPFFHNMILNKRKSRQIAKDACFLYSFGIFPLSKPRISGCYDRCLR
jgi:hypothetical protein